MIKKGKKKQRNEGRFGNGLLRFDLFAKQVGFTVGG